MWSNGGPGCSGLIGFLTEQGPFRPNKDMSIKLNEFAWNKVSNMIFVESPAGVGFSYADDKADLKTGDNQTAIDNYNLLQAFFTRFPEYRNNELFISSESYGVSQSLRIFLSFLILILLFPSGSLYANPCQADR
jgi:carboxypeptidase C (cathepsin A)